MASNINQNYKEGINDLETWALNNGEFGQQLLDEWDYTENAKHGIFLEPREYTYASHQKVWWKCKTCGRSWDTVIKRRTLAKSNCPFCYDDSHQGIKIREQDRSRTSLFEWLNTETDDFKQQLLQEWVGKDIDGNEVDNKEVTRASARKVMWRCLTCGKEWDAYIKSRTLKMSNCPFCFDASRNGKSIREQDRNKTSLYDWLNDETDDFKKQILQEWTGIDEDGNEVDIKEVTRASGKKVMWRCLQCKNKWYATVGNKTLSQQGCPKCVKNGTSFPEQFIYWSLKSIWPNTQSRVKLFKEVVGKGFEYDIYVSETDKFKGLCIEYSPTYYHKGKEKRDAYKGQLCKENGIDFIEIIEDDFDELEHVFKEDYICYRKINSMQEEQFKAIVKHILNRYGLDDKDLDYTEISAKAWNYSHGQVEEEKQLKTVYPEILKEWHPTLNGELKPERLTLKSGKRVYWQCNNCGYGKNGEWYSTVHNRTHHKHGCPRCRYNWWKTQIEEVQRLREVKKPKVYSLAQFV